MYHSLMFSGSKEIISTGSVISFNSEPITIKLFEETRQIVALKFIFKQDSAIKGQSLSTEVVNDELQLILFNFDNPIGTGTTKPMNFAQYGKKTLYLHFRVTSLSDSDRTLYYSIYAEDNEEDGKL